MICLYINCSVRNWLKYITIILFCSLYVSILLVVNVCLIRTFIITDFIIYRRCIYENRCFSFNSTQLRKNQLVTTGSRCRIDSLQVLFLLSLCFYFLLIISFSICTSKLKLKPNDVIVESETIITVHPNASKNSRRMNFALSELKEHIPNVVVKVHINELLTFCFQISLIFLKYLIFRLY